MRVVEGDEKEFVIHRSLRIETNMATAYSSGVASFSGGKHRLSLASSLTRAPFQHPGIASRDSRESEHAPCKGLKVGVLLKS